jgi:hypothetical protein
VYFWICLYHFVFKETNHTKKDVSCRLWAVAGSPGAVGGGGRLRKSMVMEKSMVIRPGCL